MKWLMVLVTLLALNCSTVKPNIINIVPTESIKPQVELGWNPVDSNGDRWEYIGERYTPRGKDRAMHVVGKCSYTYMKISGVEHWKGTYYWTETDFMMGHAAVKSDCENLSGCVEWIEHMMNGDYYL